MTGLPAVRWGGAVWVLPLAPRSAEGLAAVLLRIAGNTGRLAERGASGAPDADLDWAAGVVAELLRGDPALAIFAALEFLSFAPSAAGTPVDVDELAVWLVEVLPQLWLDGNRALAGRAGRNGDAQCSLSPKCWQALYQRTTSQPIDRWMESAGDWLEMVGPPVPPAWRASWPQLVDSAADEESDGGADDPPGGVPLAEQDPGYGTARLDLSQLARTLREQRVLRDRFSTRLEAEKMASLQQLAYGLSHEINNPLANISTRAQQLAAGEADAERRDRLGRITESAMRAHEMIADLMYFARPPRLRLEQVDVAELAAGVVGEWEPRCGERNIRIGLRVAPEVERMAVVGDRDQLSDALRAMVRNAVEAVGTSGAIQVEVDRRGRRLRIGVADSGPGLSDEARRHAFDPYYSGREAGRGLGLGLCRVYRVARAHGGNVSITSLAVGCRTRMWIRIERRK